MLLFSYNTNVFGLDTDEEVDTADSLEVEEGDAETERGRRRESEEEQNEKGRREDNRRRRMDGNR